MGLHLIFTWEHQDSDMKEQTIFFFYERHIEIHIPTKAEV